MLSRNTYLEVDLKTIKNNIRKILRYYDEYDYYFGVVSAECYGQGGSKLIKTIVDSGINYLAVATLEEALDIRKKLIEIPILCLGNVSSQYIETCTQNNITITVNSLEYLKEIIEEEPENLKVHLEINTGMNRLGISSSEELAKTMNLMKRNNIFLEGIFTQIYNVKEEKDYLKQIELFKDITKDIDLSKIPIVHIPSSEALTTYEKLPFVNGCRLGIIMYGFTDKELLTLESTSQLISEIIQINDLKKGDNLGNNSSFKADKDIKVGIIPIGYGDGIIRKNIGRNVYINNGPYKIIGEIGMDMLFVEIDEAVNVHDEVFVLKDNEHIKEVAKHLDTIPYEVISMISKRVNRIYKQ